ncbi:MAG: helix-turn-helix domain-containing protein [Armatimonadetes bacterium]|nr:helix-turn-helix domain-containing protein [Armatimonadota bacterium]
MIINNKKEVRILPKEKETNDPLSQYSGGEDGPDDVLDLEEAVAFLKTTKPTMYRWVGMGGLKGFKVGRQWRFYRSDLRKFLEYEDPTAAGIDLEAVASAVRDLDERIRKAKASHSKGD